MQTFFSDLCRKCNVLYFRVIYLLYSSQCICCGGVWKRDISVPMLPLNVFPEFESRGRINLRIDLTELLRSSHQTFSRGVTVYVSVCVCERERESLRQTVRTISRWRSHMCVQWDKCWWLGWLQADTTLIILGLLSLLLPPQHSKEHLLHRHRV